MKKKPEHIFNQLWAEAMIIYHSEENKGNLLKFTKEMQKGN